MQTPRATGKVRVAFETLLPLSDDDPLRGISAWIRLVIWTNPDETQLPHVNMASDLRDLFRASLQTFKDARTGTDFGLYLTDYDALKVETRDGVSQWEGDLVPPQTFLDYLDRDERRKKIREGRGP